MREFHGAVCAIMPWISFNNLFIFQGKEKVLTIVQCICHPSSQHQRDDIGQSMLCFKEYIGVVTLQVAAVVLTTAAPLYKVSCWYRGDLTQTFCTDTRVQQILTGGLERRRRDCDHPSSQPPRSGPQPCCLGSQFLCFPS